MKILLTNAEGFCLSESSKPIYSPGYENPNLNKSEHECLCIMNKLIETRLRQEGHDVLARRYDDSKQSCFMFDKAREARGCTAAIMLALNNSQHNDAQFSTALLHQNQDVNSRKLFESVMYALGRFMPIQSRYPNSSRRIPYLDTCFKSGVPAVIILPFFITDRRLNSDILGSRIQEAATAVSEAILAFKPEDYRDVTEY